MGWYVVCVGMAVWSYGRLIVWFYGCAVHMRYRLSLNPPCVAGREAWLNNDIHRNVLEAVIGNDRQVFSFRELWVERMVKTSNPPIQNWPQIGQDYPLNLSISVSGGKENNNDSPSSGE